MDADIDLSIVIPVFNEEESLPILLEELATALGPLQRPYEILCIDDASTDSSASVLGELQKEYPGLRVATHRVNCGESAGQATGFQLARGKIIITMDADLQNDPADIPAFLEALTDEVECVCGIRKVRRDDLVKRFSSRTANRFRDLITGDRIQDAGCTYRAIRRRAVREILVFNGMHRFIPTLLRAQGYAIAEIPVNHRPRTRGYSKYGVGNRLWRGIRDCFAIRWYRARSLPADRLDAGSE
ncbi:MAG: glycosyltransferase family 2 protein [Gammaproteobacteria bacterium]|jgi:glycosyltransferase involved in cell wall biosynthesis